LTCSCVAPNAFICMQNGCSPDEVCTQVGIDYQCQVPAVDPCLSNPCLNTGICIGDADAQTYTCQCMPGFTGTNCEDVVVPPTNECHQVPAIENGRHHWFENEGNWPAEICRVQYECNDGFQLVGHRDLYCYKGHWSGVAPVCEVVMCDPLLAPANAAFEFVGAVPPYMMYSIAEFTCDKGFEISGNHDYVLICLPDKSWSNVPPTCDPLAPCHDDADEKPVTPVKPSTPVAPEPETPVAPSPVAPSPVAPSPVAPSPVSPPSPKSPIVVPSGSASGSSGSASGSGS